MSEGSYELTEPVAGFSEGDILDVTARFGDWHLYDVKLESRSSVESGSVEMTARKLEFVGEPVESTA
jgi:hypothetical protein